MFAEFVQHDEVAGEATAGAAAGGLDLVSVAVAAADRFLSVAEDGGEAEGVEFFVGLDHLQRAVPDFFGGVEVLGGAEDEVAVADAVEEVQGQYLGDRRFSVLPGN